MGHICWLTSSFVLTPLYPHPPVRPSALTGTVLADRGHPHCLFQCYPSASQTTSPAYSPLRSKAVFSLPPAMAAGGMLLLIIIVLLTVLGPSPSPEVVCAPTTCQPLVCLPFRFAAAQTSSSIFTMLTCGVGSKDTSTHHARSS